MRAHSALLATAVLALAPAAPRAQAPTIPPVPSPAYLPGTFSAIDGVHTFSGCASGRVTFAPGAGTVVGTAFCVSGLLTLGRTPSPGVRDALTGVLQYAVTGDARIETPYAERTDVQLVTGQFLSGACGVGCAGAVPFADARGAHGAQIFTALSLGPIPAGQTFRPDRVTVQLGYQQPDGSGFGRLQTTFTLTAVPEPSTFALAAVGGLALVGVARRRA